MKMGPIAPQDPVRQRQFYYVMLDKMISIFPVPGGKNASIIFANDGRLKSASELVGNVTDDKILDLLATTEGVRKLIYGIGVSMITDTGEGAKFFFDQNGSPIQNSVIGTSQNWAASNESNGPQYGSRWNSNPAALSLSLKTL